MTIVKFCRDSAAAGRAPITLAGGRAPLVTGCRTESGIAQLPSGHQQQVGLGGQPVCVRHRDPATCELRDAVALKPADDA